MNTIQLRKQNKKKEKTRQIPLNLSQEAIKNRLLRHFQNHIGEQNKTTLQELFEVCIGLNPLQVDSFARWYWIGIIKQLMRQLRSRDKCFILKKDKGYFVLQDTIECDYYKGLCDSAIKKMEKSKIRAEDWVEKEKWNNMENPSEEDTLEETRPIEEEKSILSDTSEKKVEKIEEKIDNLKTRVIKIWKGEKE